MASYKEALDVVLAAEGGYSIHPNDRGNYNSRRQLVGTKYGISAPLMEETLRMAPSRSDMESITPNEAMALYCVRFWMPIRGKQINSQKVATVLLDGCVNHGLGTGVRLIQRAAGVIQDGIVGPQTLGAINNHPDEDRLIELFLKFREDIYRGDSTAGTFLRGWLARLEKFVGLKNEDDGRV